MATLAKRLRGRKSTTPPSFTPLSYSPLLWLDSSDNSTITESSTFVSEWRDKSGNDAHAGQVTGTNQPIKNSEGIVFDGFDDFLQLPTNSVQIGTYTLFFIYTCLSPGVSRGMFSDEATFWFIQTGGGNTFQDSNISNTITSINAVNRIVSCHKTLAVSGGNIYFNGVNESLGGLSLGTTNYIDYIGKRRLGENYLAFTLKEFIVISSNLGTVDREKFEGYLAHKYSLQANLDNAHPYRYSPP